VALVATTLAGAVELELVEVSPVSKLHALKGLKTGIWGPSKRVKTAPKPATTGQKEIHFHRSREIH